MSYDGAARAVMNVGGQQRLCQFGRDWVLWGFLVGCCIFVRGSIKTQQKNGKEKIKSL